MTKTIQLSVNGRALSAEVEPRLQLADFLREDLLLTGTHLGCEHGVCGACTVEIDGAPARSCIAYAVACDGAQVRTIEGFDDDPVMAELREAFSAEHALQCGYCTPGMLVTARDIVLRLPDADEARIREELAGNLCRCTGYVGIVRAIESVIARQAPRRSNPEALATEREIRAPRDRHDAFVGASRRQPGGSSREAPAPEQSSQSPGSPSRMAPRDDRFVTSTGRGSATATGPAASPSSADAGTGKPQTSLKQSFTVDHPRDKVWAFFARLGEVTTCLPGASVSGTPTNDHVDMRLRVKVGPIVAEFDGAADAVREAANYSGLIRGAAKDTRSSTTTRGEIRYVLLEEKDGAATRVDLDVGYTLTGALAQFSRAGIVQDIAKRMTAAFAQNLQARLAQDDGGVRADGTAPTPVAELDAGSLFLSALWNRMKTFFRSLLGR